MTAFTSIVRKEAREHRLVLAILAALTVAISFAPFLADVPGVRSSVLPCLVAAFGVLAVSLTVAPSLVPAESGEGLRFLGRLPVRPRTVFLAKITFLTAAALALGSLGYGAAFLTRGLVAAADPSLRLKWLDVAMIASPLVVGLWLVAITCLIPRPLAAIPAAAVAFVVIGAPIWWAFRGPQVGSELAPCRGLQPSTSAVAALAVLAALAPLAGAWLGFRRMLAGGAGSGRTALLVAGALACFALPAWGWSYWERWRYENVEPTDRDAEITEAYLSVDGSRAYLNVKNTRRTDWMPYSFVVDLAAGKVIGRGGPNSRYGTLTSWEGGLPSQMLATREALFLQTTDLELVDCATGRRRVVPARRPSLQFPELYEADLRAAWGDLCTAVPYEPYIPPESRKNGALGSFDRICRPLGVCALRDASGREVLYFGRECRAHLGLFDAAKDTITLATGDWSHGADVNGRLVPLRWDSPDTITVLAHGKRIERLRFGSDWREVLFPRE